MSCQKRRVAWWLPLFFLSAVTCLGSDQFRPDPVAVFVGPEAGKWARVEHLVDPHPGFKQEAFAPGAGQLDPTVQRWFGGTRTPHSGHFLLHCAPGYDGKTFPNPVLLIHGAGDNANRGWVHPLEFVLPPDLPADQEGYALKLARLGYSVFAVTFAHNQGDNFFQAEHVANAITRIRTLLHRENDPTFKVDLVAHSKGNVAARLYISDGRIIYPKKTFLSRFRKDVRKYIGIAGPQRGIDMVFRYYLYNLLVARDLASGKGAHAPMGCDLILVNGVWHECASDSVFPDSPNCYPGQAQMAYNLVRDGGIPLGPESATADMNMTATLLYFGGHNLAISSRGIDKAIDAGERLIYRLEARGADPSVQIALLAGNYPVLDVKLKKLLLPEMFSLAVYATDGIVFVQSALHSDGLVRRGARLIGKEVLGCNHLELTYKDEPLKLIDKWLMLGTAH
ncbi:MAG: hypothetical protein GX442_12655 [Candidatus Riflebacteria bacterium]|nr:hypothetical protein [Candidatus Riflebacteria bacterium]